MKPIITAAVLSLALAPASALADERPGDAALGALSGALVLGPIGLVAGAAIGFAAGPSISHSLGTNRTRPTAAVPSSAKNPRSAQAPQPKARPALPDAMAKRVAPPADKRWDGPPAQGLE